MLPSICGGLFMNKFYIIDYNSAIGLIEIIGSNEAVCSIMFCERNAPVNHIEVDTPEVLKNCYDQLDEYFNGIRKEFTFPMYIEGTDFQKRVWNALKNIKYADTCSYKDIAISIGNEKAIRAVGNANGKNQLSIVIPCHRIIGANGTLTGYAGGLWRKEWLLQHEKTHEENQTI
jgi:methylated-DNA-[protein]-cysteine S-methyltransferase